MPSLKKKATPKRRTQSAMEYLMTYGWAILIIAVVLSVLYYIGVFNGANLAPRLPPGSCQVVRPEGPGTTQDINTEGECLNSLPMYVAKFNVTANSFISVSPGSLPLGDSARSVFAWIYTNNAFTTGTSGGDVFSYGTTTASEISRLSVANELVQFQGSSNGYTSTFQIPEGAWVFIGYVYSAGPTNSITIYFDGKSESSTLPNGALDTILPSSDPADIARKSSGSHSNYFNGYISNIQVYNTSLDSNSVESLYAEGIGGVPENLQSLVAWWPLDGNANDYSGNLDNGAPTNVVFTTSWVNHYLST